MIKARLIAPYPGLAEIARKIGEHQPEIELDTTIGNLEEGVEAARQAEKEGCDIIISRGGTATMIQEEVSIPVAHIDVTGYDMLRVFTLVKGMEKGVALVGFPNISQGAATICNILEFDVKMITINHRNEVEGHLMNLKKQGFEVVIGDVITIQAAEKVGLRGVLITSGKEAVSEAFEETKRLYNLFNKVRNRSLIPLKVFQSLPYPLLIVNRKMELVLSNEEMEEAITAKGIVNTDQFASLLQQSFETMGSQWGKIEFNNQLFRVETFSILSDESLMGVSITSLSDDFSVAQVTSIQSPAHLPIIGISEHADRLRQRVLLSAKDKRTISIFGEAGTGRESVARAIHFEKYGHGTPFVKVEGAFLHDTPETRKELKSLFSHTSKGTILIKDMEAIPLSSQHFLFKLLNEGSQHLFLIFISNTELAELVRIGKFYKKLYEQLVENAIHLQPLRFRKEDISPFIHYFLAEGHAQDGNETLSIKEEAVDYLKQYEWPGNFVQLKQVVHELAEMASGYYIELEHVKELMAGYIHPLERKEAGENQLLLQGKLKDIEQQVINQVLREEGNNQSKAAMRLGINRSTLWRKLNQ